jgi:hypothetical protein
LHDIILLLGGSGSGKTFIEVYKIVRDSLRYKAPCLIARDKLIDLTTGVIDQIIPAVLQLIAEANGQKSWETWKIDGLRFATWTDKRTKLVFCTGGYIRFAGLSKRDMTESGSDKILSPSWLHIGIEEVSEVEWSMIELLVTRLRFQASGVTNKLVMTENPPSMYHFSYKRFLELKREDGSSLSRAEIGRQAYLFMQPKDNEENLSENYLRNLSQLSGANRERFYEGKFQDSEQGEIFKRIVWSDNLPRPYDWDRLIVYTDPTPLTGREHSIYADYKASVLCGLFEDKTYVLDVRIVQGSTLDMLNNMKQLWDASPNQSITEVLMEKKQVPSDFGQVMQSFAVTTGWVCPIKYDTRNFGEKKAAIETFLEPLFENDKIIFNEAFRNTERGRQTQHQVLKFSRRTNKLLHDDILDAIMKADTKMKGKQGKRVRSKDVPIVTFVRPAFIKDYRNG